MNFFYFMWLLLSSDTSVSLFASPSLPLCLSLSFSLSPCVSLYISVLISICIDFHLYRCLCLYIYGCPFFVFIGGATEFAAAVVSRGGRGG